MSWNPLHWSYQAWQLFFVIAGGWNLLGAYGGILKPVENLRQYYNVKTDDFMTITLNRVFWISVLIFSVGYFLIALNPILFYGVIVLGIMGKISISAIWIYLFRIGKAEKVAIISASGDLIFTIFFIVCLFSDIITA